ncbi:MAG: site-2 protease family protein [Acidimicrobiales bacterium]
MRGRSELSLGRILGVRVGVSWGLLAISTFFAFSLAVNSYPFAFPGRDGSRYWAAAVATTVLFVASILLHEMAHALVARGDGVGVSGVTLWMFGGVARLTSLPRTSAAEARIALAGPASNGILAGVFWALAMLTEPTVGASIASEMFDWLSRTNLLLLGVNLLPALPLDGGRVVGAVTWKLSGRRDTGDMVASRAGWLIGGLLVLYGLVQFRRGGAEGLWMLVVGAFVLSSAGSFERQRRSAGFLAGRTVGDIMRPDPPIVEDWMNVEDLLRHLQSLVPPGTAYQGHDVFPVRDAVGEIIGVVRLATALTIPPARRHEFRLEQLTEPRRDVPVVAVDAPLLEVLADHPELRHGTVLVVDRNRRIVGMLGPQVLEAYQLTDS